MAFNATVNSASAASPSIGPQDIGFKDDPQIERFAALKDHTQTGPDPGEHQRAEDDADPMVQAKRRTETPRNAGIRLATKNGTTGTSRIDSRTGISLARMPSLNRRTAPSEASMRAFSPAPSPLRTARKIATAPSVAPVTL